MPNQYSPRLSDETVRAIIRDRDNGMSFHAIASKYRCCVSMAWKIANGTTRRAADRDSGAEMTADELDALVAARMQRLPKWWRDECPQERREKRLPQAVARGMGIQSRGERRRAG